MELIGNSLAITTPVALALSTMPARLGGMRALRTMLICAFVIAGQLTASSAADDGYLRDGPFAASMDMTRTADGAVVVSLGELMTEELVPKEARKLYKKALKSDRKGEIRRSTGTDRGRDRD